MLVKFGSYNRVVPPSQIKMSKDGFVQCQILKNFICRDKEIHKVGGTQAYNSNILGNPITWVKRAYHKLGDGTNVARSLCFSNGIIYYGDDATGTLNATNATGMYLGAKPLDATFQVAGNSLLYTYTGYDIPFKYNGNANYSFEVTSLDSSITMGVSHLDRMFYIKRNSSSLEYSEELDPETIEDEIIVGNEKDSSSVAIVKGADESFYIFKSNSIYQLFGRTPTTFQIRLVTDKYGLQNKRAIYPVASGFVFQNSYDKELFFFGGSEASIIPLTESEIKLRTLQDQTVDSLENSCMTVHDGLFRFAFQPFDSNLDYNTAELVYPIGEPQASGLPKWSYIEGTQVNCYSVWNQQGDRQELLTGRSDVGKIMYHNRGHDFDGNAIDCQLRSGDIILSENMVCTIDEFHIRGETSNSVKTVNFRYYMDGRTSQYGNHPLSMKGEVRTMGSVLISKSILFNERIIPFDSENEGNSITLEFVDNQNGTDINLYSVAFKARELWKVGS